MATSTGAGSASRLGQIDILKGLAAIAVVATHSYTAEQLVKGWTVFHIWQAVPVFIVVLGLTSSLSFGRRASDSASGLPAYVRRRAVRILGPFTLAWILAAFIGRHAGRMNVGLETLALRLPYGGPGNYFVPVVIVLLLIAPFFYAWYRRAPTATVVGAFALDLLFEIWAGSMLLFSQHPYVYSIVFARYLAAFALGFFIADGRITDGKKWLVLGVGAVASVSYLAFGNVGLVDTPFVEAWRTQNVLAVFYPALLVMIGLQLLPREPSGWLAVALASVGKASYHIFLMQMLFFVLVGQGKSGLLIVSIVFCVFSGIGFLATEEAIVTRTGVKLPLPSDT